MPQTRLTQQMTFLTEACRLKQIDRQNLLQDQSRRENSAEHSWHVALFALILTAPHIKGADRDRAIAMILLHDLVEIDAGDHPIDEDHDPEEVAAKEQAAADRLFGLLPDDQEAALRALWQEFEAANTTTARLAKQMDHLHPILQTVCATNPHPDHVTVVRGNLSHGRARPLAQDWPEMFDLVQARLDGKTPKATDLAAQVRFLNEADHLKSVIRATRIAGGSRRENSAEHSWHLALYALVLGEHAADGTNITRVINMLLLHDLVEIDAGDTPIFGHHDQALQDLQEKAAAERIFDLLPCDQAREFHALWQEFEANETQDARFAKSLDRFQPPNQNLASGGGSWVEYNVSFATVADRVGSKIAAAAPQLWDWVAPQIEAYIAGLKR